MHTLNGTLLGMLSMAVRKDEQGWDLLLPTLLLAHRTSHHATTRSTPFELMIGHDPRLPEDVLFMQQAHARVLQYMELQQQRQKEYYDKGVTEKTYAVSEFVFLHNPAVGGGYSKKLHKPWEGPF